MSTRLFHRIPRVFSYTDPLIMEGEGDCACPVNLDVARPIQPRPLNVHAPICRVVGLQVPINDTFVAELPTYLAANLTILDQVAVAMFEQFTQPRIPVEIAAQLSSQWDQSVTLCTIQQMWDGGILASPDQVPDMQCMSDHALHVWLHVTNACNLRCAYCYVDQSPAKMSAATGRRAVDAIIRAAQERGLHHVRLKFGGGEPLLNFERVLTIYDYARQCAQANALTVSGVVMSNGTLLEQHHIAELKTRGLKLMISIDGMDGVVDERVFANGESSQPSVLRAIKWAIDGGLAPHLSITLKPHTLDAATNLVERALANDLTFALNFRRECATTPTADAISYHEQAMIEGMRGILAVIEDWLKRSPLRWSLLRGLLDRVNLAIPHQYPCGVGRNYLVIDHQGRVAMCHMQLAHPISTVDRPSPLTDVIHNYEGVQNVPVDEKVGCQTCEWRYWCAGGCPLETYRFTMRYDASSPNCVIYRALMPSIVRLEGLRLLHLTNPGQRRC